MPEFFYDVRDAQGRCWKRNVSINHQEVPFALRDFPQLRPTDGTNIPIEDQPEFIPLTCDSEGNFWDEDVVEPAELSHDMLLLLQQEEDTWICDVANGREHGLLHDPFSSL